MDRKVNTKSEQNFNPRLALISLSGTGPRGLNRTYQIALRALCQCPFCRIRGLTGVSFLEQIFAISCLHVYIYYNNNDNNKGVSWFHRLYIFFFLANYIVLFITLFNTLYSSSSTIT